MREHGVLQHILARPIEPNADGKRLQIIFGETRWQACLKLDPSFPVPCQVREMDDKEAAKIHAIENFQRQDLTPCQEARELQHLMQVGWNLDEIMHHVSRKKDWCYRRLSILKLPEEGQRAIDERKLTVKVAQKISELPDAVRSTAVAACIRPVHSADPLVEREALATIESEFILPLKKKERWEARRKDLLRKIPGSIFLDYEDALAAGRDHEFDLELVEDSPTFHLLSPAAQKGDLEVPTWGDLAERHQSPVYIGIGLDDEPVLYIKPEPIIAAEKAAHRDDPTACVFLMDEHKAVMRSEAEKYRHKEHVEKQRLKELEKQWEKETVSIAWHVFAGGLREDVEKDLALSMFEAGVRPYLQEWTTPDLSLAEFLRVTPLDGETEDEVKERCIDSLREVVASPQSGTPLEMVSRIMISLVYILNDYKEAVSHFPFLIDSEASPHLHTYQQQEHDQTH